MSISENEMKDAGVNMEDDILIPEKFLNWDPCDCGISFYDGYGCKCDRSKLVFIKDTICNLLIVLQKLEKRLKSTEVQDGKASDEEEEDYFGIGKKFEELEKRILSIENKLDCK